MIRGPILSDSAFQRYLIIFLTLSPMIYLWFHGRANALLVDTTAHDRLAKFFYVVSTLFVLGIYFANAPKGPWTPPNPARWKCVEVPAVGPR
jgi:hypothetical protein